MELKQKPESTIVVTVHGIRTFGKWQERLETLVNKSSQDEKIFVTHYKYGYFSAPAFLFPPARSYEIKKLKKALVKLLSSIEFERLVVVAHSFGTFVAAKALLSKEVRDHLPNKIAVIFSGSVLPKQFDAKQFEQIGVSKFVNDCGSSDIALLASNYLGIGTGMAGRSGFTGMESSAFRNRYFNFGHGGFF